MLFDISGTSALAISHTHAREHTQISFFTVERRKEGKGGGNMKDRRETEMEKMKKDVSAEAALSNNKPSR